MQSQRQHTDAHSEIPLLSECGGHAGLVPAGTCPLLGKPTMSDTSVQYCQSFLYRLHTIQLYRNVQPKVQFMCLHSRYMNVVFSVQAAHHK